MTWDGRTVAAAKCDDSGFALGNPRCDLIPIWAFAEEWIASVHQPIAALKNMFAA
jgi:hypothetical protein